MQKQIHAYYSGRVQGVGFRFTAEHIAGELGVTGWVKNLPDGRVEIVAQAKEDTLREFLEKIDQYFSRYISGAQVEWQGVVGEFREFDVKF